MVQLSTVLVVLAAASLPTAFATSFGDEHEQFERSLDAQTSLGGPGPEPFAIPAAEPLAPGAAPFPPPPSIKSGVKQVGADIKKTGTDTKTVGSAIKQKIGLEVDHVRAALKQKAGKDIKLAGTKLKHVGDAVKLKIGADLKKGIQRLRAGARKGEGRLGRLRKLRKFRGKLSKEFSSDEFDTEILIIIKQHATHRSGRKHRFGKGKFRHPKQMMAPEPPMMDHTIPAMDKTAMPPVSTVEHTPASAPPAAAKAPMPMGKPPAKMVKTPMPMAKEMPAAPPVKSKAEDPALGPFYGIETGEGEGEPSWQAKEMKAEASKQAAPAAAPVDKTVHPKTMDW